MSCKGVSRRNFFKNVAKYCGAGVAALGLVGMKDANAGPFATPDLDIPTQSGTWRMRDAQLMQYSDFINNAPIPKDYFDKKPESLINGGAPVEWSHLHPNYYTDDQKRALVGMIMATKLDQDLPGDIKKAMKLVGGFEKSLKKTDKILIKPNMNTGDPWPGGGTDPLFLKALITVLKDQGYTNITVADTCGPWGPTERVINMMGYDAVGKETGTPVKTWEKEQWMNIRNAKAEFLGKMGGGDGTVAYPADLRTYDKVIYTPVMKTHLLGGITQSLKLSVGLLHRADRGKYLHSFNHIFVAQQAAEINLPFRPDLIVMDGRRSFIAGGPSQGEEVKPGVIIVSGCQVANDVTGHQDPSGVVPEHGGQQDRHVRLLSEADRTGGKTRYWIHQERG